MRGIGKKRIPKGQPGYIRSEKVRRSLVTFVLFLIPLVIFVTGLIQTKTRLNLFTVVAILGCLPASRSAVGMIMMLMQKPAGPQISEKTKKAAGKGIALFELCFTSYEKNILVDAVVINGSQVIGVTGNPKADTAFLEKHIREILKQNGYSRSVKIFRDQKPFLERAAALDRSASETDKKYLQEQEENVYVKAVILQIAL